METVGVNLAAPVLRLLHEQRAIASTLLEQVGEEDPVFARNRARVLAAGEPLLAEAQRAGELRADLTLEQMLDLTIAVAKIHGDAGYVTPILRAAVDGLRAPADPSPARPQVRSLENGRAAQ